MSTSVKEPDWKFLAYTFFYRLFFGSSRQQIIVTVGKFKIRRHNISQLNSFTLLFPSMSFHSQTHLMRTNEPTTQSALIRWGCQIRGAPPPPPPRSRGKILLCWNGEKQLSRRANSITACLSDVPAAARRQRDRYEGFFYFGLFFCFFLWPLSDGNIGCVTHPQPMETCLYPLAHPRPTPPLHLMFMKCRCNNQPWFY